MHAGKNDDEIQFPAVAGKKGRTNQNQIPGLV